LLQKTHLQLVFVKLKIFYAQLSAVSQYNWRVFQNPQKFMSHRCHLFLSNDSLTVGILLVYQWTDDINGFDELEDELNFRHK
jgi:hypothetical protein